MGIVCTASRGPTSLLMMMMTGIRDIPLNTMTLSGAATLVEAPSQGLAAYNAGRPQPLAVHGRLPKLRAGAIEVNLLAIRGSDEGYVLEALGSEGRVVGDVAPVSHLRFFLLHGSW